MREDDAKEHFERADRLLEYVKGEIRNMRIDARMEFVAKLFDYCTPEVKALLEQRRIEPV